MEKKPITVGKYVGMPSKKRGICRKNCPSFKKIFYSRALISEFPAFIYGEALVDPHEDMVVVDDFVGSGKDGYSIKSGLAF